MILYKQIWIREYFSCIKSHIFMIIQICLAFFLINHQIGYISYELGRISSIVDAGSDTWLFQYSMAACGLYDNGDYTTAYNKISSLPGVEEVGEIFMASGLMEGNVERNLEDFFSIDALDSLATSAVTYNMKEGRWLNESDREGNVIHAVLGGSMADRYKIGDKISIDLDSETRETFEIEVIGKLADHCWKLDMAGLSASQNMYSFMTESEDTIFINNNKVFNMIKEYGFGHATAHCIVKLDKNADKKFLSNYGKLVSFEEMLQETMEDLNDFIKDAAVETVIWTVVIIFGIIAVSYMIGKRRRYVWGIYLMLEEQPKNLLKIHMINNGVTYIIAIAISLLIYEIYYRNEEMEMLLMSHVGLYHIIINIAFLIIMMVVSLMSNLYILKMEPKEILTQTKE